MAYRHTPVLLQEVIRGLQPQPGQHMADGTVGGGGHAEALLDATAPDGLLLAFDRDADALTAARVRLKRFGTRVTFIHRSYAALGDVARAHGLAGKLSGVLLDLGFSSAQLDDSRRGFSFQTSGELDLRYDERQTVTAAHLLNTLSERELADIFTTFGEEPQAARLASAILDARRLRPLATTDDLLAIIMETKRGSRRRSFHPATLVWQALRIAVNGELDELKLGLQAALDVLAPAGRLAVISFQSGEDRLVKEFLRHESTSCLCEPTAPICRCGHHATLRRLGRAQHPSAPEVAHNPRARSAKLRLAVKLS